MGKGLRAGVVAIVALGVVWAAVVIGALVYVFKNGDGPDKVLAVLLIVISSGVKMRISSD